MAAQIRTEVQVPPLFGNLIIQPVVFGTGRVAMFLGVVKRGVACPTVREPELIQTVPGLETDGLKRVWSPTRPRSSHLPLHSTSQLQSDVADKYYR